MWMWICAHQIYEYNLADIVNKKSISSHSFLAPWDLVNVEAKAKQSLLMTSDMHQIWLHGWYFGKCLVVILIRKLLSTRNLPNNCRLNCAPKTDWFLRTTVIALHPRSRQLKQKLPRLQKYKRFFCLLLKVLSFSLIIFGMNMLVHSSATTKNDCAVSLPSSTPWFD